MKYVPSALIGRLSRSAGSTTAGHNRYGAYLRNRVIPTNPVTPSQTAVRESFGDLSAQYRALADTAVWSAYGQNFARTDSLGEAYTLTGLQAFVSVNQNRATLGLAPITTPALYAIPGGLTGQSLAAVGTVAALDLTFANTPVPAGHSVLVFATRPVSAGIQFQPPGAYKLIEILDPAATSPADILASYTAKFGAFVAGEAILVKTIVVNQATGLASPAVHSRAVAS